MNTATLNTIKIARWRDAAQCRGLPSMHKALCSNPSNTKIQNKSIGGLTAQNCFHPVSQNLSLFPILSCLENLFSLVFLQGESSGSSPILSCLNPTISSRWPMQPFIPWPEILLAIYSDFNTQLTLSGSPPHPLEYLVLIFCFIYYLCV